jgi:hypothetical protein
MCHYEIFPEIRVYCFLCVLLYYSKSMILTALFLQSTKGASKAIDPRFYRALSEFWEDRGMPIPRIDQVARATKSIIIVAHQRIIGTAIVHKTNVMDDRTKTLRKITIPQGSSGDAPLDKIVELFAQEGTTARASFIHDDIGPIRMEKRRAIYAQYGFDRNVCFLPKG